MLDERCAVPTGAEARACLAVSRDGRASCDGGGGEGVRGSGGGTVDRDAGGERCAMGGARLAVGDAPRRSTGATGIRGGRSIVPPAQYSSAPPRAVRSPPRCRMPSLGRRNRSRRAATRRSTRACDANAQTSPGAWASCNGGRAPAHAWVAGPASNGWRGVGCVGWAAAAGGYAWASESRIEDRREPETE